MPNIFPPIQLQQPAVGAMLPSSDVAPGVLGSVSAPSSASLAVNADTNKLQADTPHKYDYSAHGVLGNIGHVLGRVGNVAADILDPRIAPLIPGTDEYKQKQMDRDQNQLNMDTQRQDNAQKEADAVENQKANREAEQPVRDAEVAKDNEQIDAAKNPSWQHVETDQGMFALNPKTNELVPLTYQGKPLMKPQTASQKPDTPEQQAIDEYQKLHPGATVAQAEHAYAENTHIQQPPQVLMMIPNANGGSTAQVVRPGSTVAPGAQTAAGVNTANSLTSQQRNSAGRAQQVLDSIPDVLNDLHANAAQLGPGMGRFNDIYSGKIGAPNPEFAGLVSDLKLLGTSVAIAHAQGRMSNELLHEFNDMIASPQQDPRNIEAVIGKVQNFMQRAAHQKPAGSQGAAGDAQPAADYKLVNGKLVKQ